MKVKCRKCEIEWEWENMTFEDVKYIQSLACGIMGTHMVIGCS